MGSLVFFFLILLKKKGWMKAWWFKSCPFWNGEKGDPVKGLSDLQLGDEKGTAWITWSVSLFWEVLGISWLFLVNESLYSKKPYRRVLESGMFFFLSGLHLRYLSKNWKSSKSTNETKWKVTVQNRSWEIQVACTHSRKKSSTCNEAREDLSGTFNRKASPPSVSPLFDASRI